MKFVGTRIVCCVFPNGSFFSGFFSLMLQFLFSVTFLLEKVLSARLQD